MTLAEICYKYDQLTLNGTLPVDQVLLTQAAIYPNQTAYGKLISCQPATQTAPGYLDRITPPPAPPISQPVPNLALYKTVAQDTLAQLTKRPPALTGLQVSATMITLPRPALLLIDGRTATVMMPR